MAGRGVYVSFMLPAGTQVAGSKKGPSEQPIPGWLRVLDDDADYEDYTSPSAIGSEGKERNREAISEQADDDDSDGLERRRSSNSRGCVVLLKLISEKVRYD